MCGVLRSPVPLWNSFHSCVWQWQCLPQSWGAKKGDMYIILGAPSNCGLSQYTEIPWSREALGTPCTLSLGCGPTVFLLATRTTLLRRRHTGDCCGTHTISCHFQTSSKKRFVLQLLGDHSYECSSFHIRWCKGSYLSTNYLYSDDD